MPIYSYLCNQCGHEFDELRPYDPDEHAIACAHGCGLSATKLPSRFGGYNMSSGGSSTRPKGAGSSKGRSKLNFKENK